MRHARRSRPNATNARRKSSRGFGALVGVLATLGVALAAGYALTDGYTGLKPATGTANAMALASEEPAKR